MEDGVGFLGVLREGDCFLVDVDARHVVARAG